MPITLRRTLVKIGGSLRLTIPPEIAQLLGVREGDGIEFASTNGDVIIRKGAPQSGFQLVGKTEVRGKGGRRSAE